MPDTAASANGKRTVPLSNGKATYAEKHNLADHFIGGNRLADAPASKVKDFVASHDGHTVITNVCSTPFNRNWVEGCIRALWPTLPILC